MKKLVMSFAAFGGLLLAPGAGHAAVEYVRVCSVYGSGFHYIPGTDTCLNGATGDARQQTEGGTWRSVLPYPEGEWVESAQQACRSGRLVSLGTFASTDFAANAWNRKQTRAIPVAPRRGEYVAKVIMSGGFSDPRTPNRHGVNGMDGLCVRSVDPGVVENYPEGAINPAFGNGMLPVGCVANSRIVNMPASYAVSATSAYPSIDSFYLDGGQAAVSGPYTYGTHLVVTTDFGNSGMQQLTYFDARTGASQPLAGAVTVSVCMQQGHSR